MTIDVIVNAGGGRFVEGETDDRISNEFAASGVNAELHLAHSGEELIEIAAAAAASDSTTLVATGGDGTVNAVASNVADANKTLGVLPLGTLNHFSKDVNIPADLPSAIAVIAAGNTERIDLGEVNGQAFVNNSSIGLYPRIVHRREQMQQRLGRGKWSSAFAAAIKTVRRDPFFKVTLKLNGSTITRKTSFVFVGNNEYQMELYNIGTRARLNEGSLSVYLPRHGGRSGVLRILLRTLLGLLRPHKEFETIKTDAVTIDVKRARVMVAYDGEVAMMDTPLQYRIRPKALTVLVPREAKES